ncbi:MAG: hypothetical protein ACOVP1_12290 [Bacteroidia bacterium]
MGIQVEYFVKALSENPNERQRQALAHAIVSNEIKLADLIPVLYYPHPISMRLAWVLGNVCVLQPEIISPFLTQLFQQRTAIKVIHFNRSLAKFFLHCGIPEEMEGEVLNELFIWLNGNTEDISTKSITLKVLMKCVEKYPALQFELISNLERYLTLQPNNSFSKQALIAIQHLKQMEMNSSNFNK